MIRLTVELAGHKAQVYKEAEQLLSDIAHVDILIVDLCLPGKMQGEHIAKAAQLLRQDIPIIMISAASSYEIHRRTQELVGIKILPKPFYIRELLRAIENFNHNTSNSDQRQHTQTRLDAYSGRSHPTLYALPKSRQP